MARGNAMRKEIKARWIESLRALALMPVKIVASLKLSSRSFSSSIAER